MNPKRHLLSGLSIALCAASCLQAQNSVTIKIAVLDPQGRGVDRARLSLFSSAGVTPLKSGESRDGGFEFSNLPPGHYLIEVDADGFRRAVVPTDSLTGATSTITIHLELQGVQQSVLVTAEAAAQSMDEVAKAVSVVDRAEIDNRNEYSVSETIRNVPGLVVRNLGGPGQSTSIRSRGLGPSATAILIDGLRFRDVATTQADASSFLGNLNIINPGRIEVLRGSGSSLYGTNAVGGVINIVTEERTGPMHGDVQFEGGSLGLMRGRAALSGSMRHDRLLYSAGLMHLNVLNGVDGHDRTRSTGAQMLSHYHLTGGLLAIARFWGSDDFVQPNSSPTAGGLPAANIPPTTIVDAIPLSRVQVENSLAGGPIQAANATFIPSRDDPDNRRASRFRSTAFRLQQAVTTGINWQATYHHVTTDRIFQNGPAGIGSQPVTSNRSQFRGGVDTLNGQMSVRLRSWQTVSGGYEFERESYFNSDDNRVSGPARVATETHAWQRSHALYLQNQLSLVRQKLQISVSLRGQRFALQRPEFVYTGTANPYANIPLSAPPRALTGDFAIAYFLPATGTKLRVHAGNSYRAPALSERFGSGFSFNTTTAQVVFSPFGDPRLAPDRYNSVDAGVDQYFWQRRIRVSASYFYTRILQITLFDSGSLVVRPQTDPFGRSSGYFNGAGGVSRGVELSAEAHPFRATLLNASYTYTSANTDQDVQVRGFFKTFAVPPHALTLMANRQIGARTEVTVDVYHASPYFNPLSAAGRARAYRYPALTKVDTVLSCRIWTRDKRSLHAYGKIENLLDREFYETGFRTPGITGIVGLRMTLR